MTHDLPAELAQQAGMVTAQTLARVIDVTLGLLAGQLPSHDVDDLNRGLRTLLPGHQALVEAPERRLTEATELYTELSVRSGLAYSHAAELAEVVCNYLGDHLSLELRLRLERHLPPTLAALMTSQRAPAIEPGERELIGGVSTTLAEGRPGSRHPLSEGRPERAQTHSVVRSDNPHGDTKLSSAKR
jgi:hypothetical protein